MGSDECPFVGVPALRRDYVRYTVKSRQQLYPCAPVAQENSLVSPALPMILLQTQDGLEPYRHQFGRGEVLLRTDFYVK